MGKMSADEHLGVPNFGGLGEGTGGSWEPGAGLGIGMPPGTDPWFPHP